MHRRRRRRRRRRRQRRRQRQRQRHKASEWTPYTVRVRRLLAFLLRRFPRETERVPVPWLGLGAHQNGPTSAHENGPTLEKRVGARQRPHVRGQDTFFYETFPSD